MMFLYIGCMRSGKTSNLLNVIQKYNIKQDFIFTYVPQQDFDKKTDMKTDMKIKTTYMHSRDGRKCKALSWNKDFDFKKYCQRLFGKNEYMLKPKRLIIDEVQFLTEEQIEQLRYLSKKDHWLIFLGGLALDFRAKMFPATRELLRIVEHFTFLYADCQKCKRKGVANRNLKLDENGDFILDDTKIEDMKARYISVCIDCYNKVFNRYTFFNNNQKDIDISKKEKYNFNYK